MAHLCHKNKVIHKAGYAEVQLMPKILYNIAYSFTKVVGAEIRPKRQNIEHVITSLPLKTQVLPVLVSHWDVVETVFEVKSDQLIF